MAAIFHIVGLKEWENATKVGSYRASSLDTEGFIHCSKRDQVAGVLERYYRNQSGLLILEIEEERVSSPLKLENTLGGKELFPHLYGPLNVSAVSKVHRLEDWTHLKIFHHSGCSKSRAAYELLIQSGKPFEVVDYLSSPLTREVLETLFSQLSLPPEKVVRTQEQKFKELKLDENPPGSPEEWIAVLIQNPILLERPIVTNGKRAVIGRPPENILALLRTGSG